AADAASAAAAAAPASIAHAPPDRAPAESGQLADPEAAVAEMAIAEALRIESRRTPVPTPAVAPEPTSPSAAPPAAVGAGPPATRIQTVHNSGRWLRMRVGVDVYAFELMRVQEVVRTVPTLAMRGAAASVLGVMNLRGRIVPVFDLGRWLDSGFVSADENSRIVVVERDDELIGVLVTAVEDVVTLGREHIEPPLANGDPGAILGVARTGGAPTVLLDADALFG
ncbi:chemotaxis protein CheW, partial [Lysobacter sp. D1-1-M9]